MKMMEYLGKTLTIEQILRGWFIKMHLKKMFDVIVGWTTDRLARNVREMTNLREDLRLHFSPSYLC